MIANSVHKPAENELKDGRAKIFQLIDFFLQFYRRRIMSYLCQKCPPKNGGHRLRFRDKAYGKLP